MTPRAKWIVSALAALISTMATPTARAFYCDGRMVSPGDSVEHVRAVCGAPTHEGAETILVHQTRQLAVDHYLTTITTRTVIVWTYDSGAGGLRELLIDGGVVREVRDLRNGGSSTPLEKHDEHARGQGWPEASGAPHSTVGAQTRGPAAACVGVEDDEGDASLEAQCSRILFGTALVIVTNSAIAIVA